MFLHALLYLSAGNQQRDRTDGRQVRRERGEGNFYYEHSLCEMIIFRSHNTSLIEHTTLPCRFSLGSSLTSY
jgi:hypothetical protein